MIPIPLDRLHGGNATPALLDFSASVNPLGPPPAAVAAFHAAADSIALYPKPYPAALIEALANHLDLDHCHLVAGNGSTQLFYLLARVLRPRLPFVAIPTFSEIANGLAISGFRPHALELRREKNYLLQVSDIERALRSGADAIFVGRPNSPTGSMASWTDAAEIAALCEHQRCWCIFDEAFIDFAGEGQSALAMVRSNTRLIVVRSLTKIFAIPGLRAGYLAAPKELAKRLNRALEPWSVNRVAEQVALACLEDAENFCTRTRKIVATELAWLSSVLADLRGFRVLPSAANFLMFEVDESGSEKDFAQHMLLNGIMVRNLRQLPGCGAGNYRLGIKLRPENERLVAAARTFTG